MALAVHRRSLFELVEHPALIHSSPGPQGRGRDPVIGVRLVGAPGTSRATSSSNTTRSGTRRP
ncbi:hypothetical protein G352_03159 [Rhodococcus ruber BKS 20-38]|uniref:Uncharacterized protein n=1 Tax=Rhodococcus ruber BKS 20-38 TaxID=1278076 RepID=M2ZHV2_9NOCA|nr:hypothetical protein G352_03159 [Rhodococcus ruber BKS 20-38]